VALQNLVNGLGKLVPESQKEAYNKDAAAAMKHMNALTGGPGGKSQGIAGSGSGGKEKIGDPTKKQYKQVVTKGIDKDGFSYTETKRVEITPTKKEAPVVTKDVATKNVRLSQADDDSELSDEAIEVLERSQTKDTTKIPALFKKNVLHEYASYTYHFELFVLGVDDFNNFVEDPKFTVEDLPGRLLIKSGGGSQKNRNKFFKLDYFIDDVEIASKIAPGAGNVGSVNTEVSFTVTEPYGMTLLNGLVMAAKEMGGYNYTNQPYLLKVSFKGYDKDGVLIEKASAESTRYIPIKIKKFTFGATEAGTVYNIECVPYHSLALENTKATIKTDVKVNATTIGEFLTSDITTFTKYRKKITNPMGDPEDIVDAIRSDVVQGGLAGYFNLIEKEQVKQGTKLYADEYEFVVDPDISTSTITLQDVVEYRKIKNENDPAKKAQGQFLKNFNYNESKQSYSIRAGTNLIQCIHSIMRTSTYMTNQVKNDNLQLVPDKQFSQYKENEDTPINFYRIVPKITLLDKWDTKRNCFARKMTYTIKKYNMHGKDFENFGQAPIKDVVKDYKYLYTGQNNDILNFDIQFNSAYYQKNLYQIAEKAKKSPTQKSAYDPSDFAAGNLAKTDANSVSVIAPFNKEAVIDVGSSKGISDPRSDPRSMIVDNFMQDVFSTGADLIEVSLEIIGDPAFIQSQDLRIVSNATSEAPTYFPDDKSLNPDREWHLSLSFRNPEDINTETGLYSGFGHDKDGLAEVTAPTMNGIYKAVEVDSKFTGGKFTQSIKAIRERGRQLSDFVDKSEGQKRVESVKEINQRVDLKIKQTPDIKSQLTKAIQNNSPGNPFSAANKLEPDSFDKTITGSNAVKNAIDKAGSLGKAFPPGDVNSIGEGVEAITGGWSPKPGTIAKAKKAGTNLLKSARTIAT
jgi:hypothetical protein